MKETLATLALGAALMGSTGTPVKRGGQVKKKYTQQEKNKIAKRRKANKIAAKSRKVNRSH